MALERYSGNPRTISAGIPEIGIEVQVTSRRPGLESLTDTERLLFERVLKAQSLALGLALETKHDQRDVNAAESYLSNLLDAINTQISDLEAGNTGGKSLIARMLGVDLSEPRPSNITNLSTEQLA